MFGKKLVVKEKRKNKGKNKWNGKFYFAWHFILNRQLY